MLIMDFFIISSKVFMQSLLFGYLFYKRITWKIYSKSEYKQRNQSISGGLPNIKNGRLGTEKLPMK